MNYKLLFVLQFLQKASGNTSVKDANYYISAVALKTYLILVFLALWQLSPLGKSCQLFNN